MEDRGGTANEIAGCKLRDHLGVLHQGFVLKNTAQIKHKFPI